MTTVVDQLQINFSKTLLDLTIGTIVPGVIDNLFATIQAYLTKIKLFAILNFSDSSNATLVRLLRLVIEPPVVLTSLYFTLAAFLGTDSGSAPSVFLAIVLFNGMGKYLNELNLAVLQFTTFLMGVEKESLEEVPN